MRRSPPHEGAEAEWARASALRLVRAASRGPELFLSETNAVILDITNAPKKKRRKRMSSLLLLLAGIAGDAAAQFAKVEGVTFEQYVDELEASEYFRG